MSTLAWQWRGRVPYPVARQDALDLREAILAGEGREAVWCLEHPPVITTGRRDPGPLPDAATLAATGTALVRTERGGLATWHGPGQLIVWPVVDIGRRRIGVRDFVRLLEDTVMDWLAEQGQPSCRRPGAPGVWVQEPGWQKLCAVGLHISRGVSVHGLALNLRPDLDGFSLIVPCGIADAGVTSLAALGRSVPSMEQVAEQLGERLVEAVVDASAARAGDQLGQLEEKVLAGSGRPP